MNRDLGIKIRELRLKKKFSLRELSRRSHISATFLSDVENGYKRPSRDTLSNIAHVLEIPFLELSRLDSKIPLVDIEWLENHLEGKELIHYMRHNKVTPRVVLKLLKERYAVG